MSQEAYNIVIVGAGAAGCVVASYLAEHTDASIALITYLAKKAEGGTFVAPAIKR